MCREKRNGIREIKETRPRIIIIIIIINDYCIRLNSGPSSTTGPSFLAFLLSSLLSFSPSLPVSPSRKTRTIMFFFLQATTPSKSFLFIYNNYLLLYLSSPVFAYVPVWWWLVGNNDDDDKSKNNKNIHSFLILTFCIFLSSSSILFLSLFPWFDHLYCSYRSFHSNNPLPMNSATPTNNLHFLDVDPRRLSMINAANMTATGFSISPRRTSIVNYYQRRNSQLRKSSFTTSVLVCDKV